MLKTNITSISPEEPLVSQLAMQLAVQTVSLELLVLWTWMGSG